MPSVSETAGGGPAPRPGGVAKVRRCGALRGRAARPAEGAGWAASKPVDAAGALEAGACGSAPPEDSGRFFFLNVESAISCWAVSLGAGAVDRAGGWKQA